MTRQELIMLQALPLEVKILKTKQRIREFISYFGVDGVYISFSGGKDSTVLLDIVRQEYPQVEAVFSNTGLEFPEIVQFAKSFKNVTMVRPKKTFKDVIQEHGYPIISKKSSRMLKDLQNAHDGNVKSRKLYLSRFTLDADGNQTDKPNRSFYLADKWRYLIDAPFKISNKCCDELKKNPLKTYQKQVGKVSINGTMASESKMRESAYMQTGCNIFEGNNKSCNPLGFWREQDILEYIDTYKLPIASVYGEVKKDCQGDYYTTGESRTGCVFCGFGCHLEKGENRYQRLQRTHPKLHKYCMDNLGFREVLEYINVSHSLEEEFKSEYACEKINNYEQLTFKL